MQWTWLDMVIRSAVILAAAELLRRVPRRSAPSYRHRIVLAAFGLLLLWPVFSALLPEIRVPLWPHLDTHDHVTVQQTILSVDSGRELMTAVNWSLVVWLAGVFLAFGPVIIGYVNLLRVSRQAVPLSDPSWNRVLEEISCQLKLRTKPELLVLNSPVMPLTFGLRRCRILLPVSCLDWSPLRQRAVLLHELAHIRRKDIGTQLFANVITSLWWFQPLCWTSRRNLRQESERACDAVVLASGIKPSDYAAELLDVAHRFSRDRSWSSAAIAMARRGELEGRLCAILDPAPGDATRRFSFAAISLLTLLAVTASAINIFPEQQNDLSGGLPMKRTLLAGLLASAGLSAATIGGSVFDPSGAVIPNAKALLLNPDTAAKQETQTGSDGKFVFQSLPAGSYILRIEKPGFAALFREFNVQQDSNIERGLTLNIGSIKEHVSIEAQGTPAASSEASSAKPIRVGGAVEESKLTNKVQPVYPPSAKAAGIQGTVEMEMVISKDGVPLDIRVVSSPDPALTESALEAVRQWRYSSTLLNGEPIEVVTDVIVNYTLSN